MSAASLLAYRMVAAASKGGGVGHVDIKRGDAIFGDSGIYPMRMDEFIGQEQARMQLLIAIRAAQTRRAPLPHTLFASGQPGIGKTTLAKLVAHTMGVGFVEVGGNVTLKDIKPIVTAMSDGDILFIDEIHQMVATKRVNAEWLLQLMTDGNLVTPTGVIHCPKITVIGASTDAQKLPRPILDRFKIQPELNAYTEVEAVEIAKVTAKRLDLLLQPGEFHQIAAAADYNPRIIATLLEQVRDLKLVQYADGDIIATALKWSGFSPDGLSRLEQDYLMLLLGYGGVASAATMKAVLNESVLDHSERTLIGKGYIQIVSKGRELTELGITRARELMEENAA